MTVGGSGLHRGYAVALSALTLFFFLVGARWIWLYLHAQPLDIDEAGYLSMALGDYNALLRGGFAGWVAAVEGQGPYGPLTTALASLLFCFTGPHVIAGFAVPLVAACGCIVATYFLGKALGARQIGLAASILVASCPVILSFSRSFHFSMLTTLTLTIALLALLRSERFERIGWSALFGVALGLMPLARTMTIAFIPGVVLAAVVSTVAEPSGRLRRLGVLTASLLFAALTAATWLGPNGGLVWQYLTGFGYGARSVEYGPDHSTFGPDAWLNTLELLCNHDVFLPHLMILLAGGLAALIVAGNAAFHAPEGDFLRRALRSRTLPIVIVIAEALSALTSSRAGGSAFFAPIVPAMFVVAVWALWRLSDHRSYRLAAAGLLAGVACMTSVPHIDLRTPLSLPWSATVPVLGDVRITDGRGTLRGYEAAGGLGPRDVAEPVSPAVGAAWIALDAMTAAAITHLAQPNAVVAFGFRHYLYNVNTVQLQHVIQTGTGFIMHQVEPVLTGESIDGYRLWLARENADACVVLTSDSVRGEIKPTVDRPLMQQAVEEAGFIPVQHWPTPDGQTVTLWKRRAALPHCG